MESHLELFADQELTDTQLPTTALAPSPDAAAAELASFFSAAMAADGDTAVEDVLVSALPTSQHLDHLTIDVNSRDNTGEIRASRERPSSHVNTEDDDGTTSDESSAQGDDDNSADALSIFYLSNVTRDVGLGAGASGGVRCAVCDASESDGPLWRCPVGGSEHVCCHDCMSHFTHARVSEGMSTIPCPVGFADCAHQLTPEELGAILTDEVAEEYTALAASHRVPNAVECPTCGKLCAGNPKRPDMSCDRCGLKFCFHHGLEHPERACKIKAPGSFERFRNWQWRKRHTRKCNR